MAPQLRGQSFTGTSADPVIVAPLETALITQPPQFANRYAIATGAVEFRALAPYDLAPSEPIYGTYSGSEVMTDPSAVIGPLNGMVFRRSEIIDSGFGAITIEDDRSFEEKRISLGFADDRYADRWQRRQWFHYLRGKDKTFWLPSQKNDLPLQSAIGAADTQIAVEEVTTPSDYVGRHIEIDDDGTYYHREITAAAAGAGQTLLTISALGASVPTTAIVSLMSFVRLDTDVITIRHRATGDGFFSTMQAMTVEVPA